MKGRDKLKRDSSPDYYSEVIILLDIRVDIKRNRKYEEKRELEISYIRKSENESKKTMLKKITHNKGHKQ